MQQDSPAPAKRKVLDIDTSNAFEAYEDMKGSLLKEEATGKQYR